MAGLGMCTDESSTYRIVSGGIWTSNGRWVVLAENGSIAYDPAYEEYFFVNDFVIMQTVKDCLRWVNNGQQNHN